MKKYSQRSAAPVKAKSFPSSSRDGSKSAFAGSKPAGKVWHKTKDAGSGKSATTKDWRKPKEWDKKKSFDKSKSFEKSFDKERSLKKRFDDDAPRTEGRPFRKAWGEKAPYKKAQPTRSGFKRDLSSSRAATGIDTDKRPAFNKPAFVKAAKSAKPTKPAMVRQGVMLWGTHAVREAWLNPRRQCFNLWTTEAGQTALQKTLDEAERIGLPRPALKLVERAELDQLLPPVSVHQGVVLEAAPLRELELYELTDAETPPDLIVVLDQVTDPHNIGAILRSAAAFGAGAVVMTERNAPSTTGVMAKTASGAVEYVPLIHVVNLARALTDLKEAGYWCAGLAEEGEKELSTLDLSGKTVLVLGAEGDGLRRLTRENCDELARLPTGGAIGSLNVSNAAAVALYEIRRQKIKFA